MSEIDKGMLARRFGRRAATYESVTPVQGRMAALLASELRPLAAGGQPVRRILELGCGTGRLTRQLVQQFPDAATVAVDLAPEMIARARRDCPGAEFIVADAEDYVERVASGVDLIVSNAAVQWFASPVLTLSRYRALLSAGGCLVVATFGDQTLRELRQALAVAYGSATPGAVDDHLLSLPSPDVWRRAFPDAVLRTQFFADRYPDVRSFLRALQLAGVTYAGHRRRLLSASILRRMIAHYAGREFAATYQVVSFHLSGPIAVP